MTADWRALAVCGRADPKDFSPNPITWQHLARIRDEYCDHCPVRQECLALPRKTPLATGIFGGEFFMEGRRRAVRPPKPRGAPQGNAVREAREAANEARRAAAAAAVSDRVRQALAILGDSAPSHLAIVGELRLRYPEASMRELGEMATPPITKDMVAGRLRTLAGVRHHQAVAS
jgi:hypothetical protein